MSLDDYRPRRREAAAEGAPGPVPEAVTASPPFAPPQAPLGVPPQAPFVVPPVAPPPLLPDVASPPFAPLGEAPWAPLAAPVTGPGTWGRVRFPGVVKAEWIKLWSLASTWWVVGVTLAVTVGFGALMGFSFAAMTDLAAGPATGLPGAAPTLFLASDAATMMSLGEVVVAILAVLFATNEYSSGQIRATFAAVPGRTAVLAAKAAIIGVVAFALAFAAAYGAILAAWPFMKAIAVDNRFDGGLRSALGWALATALVAMLALAVGFLVRNTAGAIGIVVALLLLVGGLLGLLPWHWVAAVRPYLIDTSQAGLYTVPGSSMMSAGPFGFVKSAWVTALWAVVPLVGAGALLKTRDA